MNYEKEINSFFDWLETNTLSVHARVLWFALMQINFRAGWKTEFSVNVSVIKMKSGLRAKYIEPARDELQQAGRITWRPYEGERTAVYHIVSLID